MTSHRGPDPCGWSSLQQKSMCLEDERLQRLKKNDKSKKGGAKEMIGCGVVQDFAIPLSVKLQVSLSWPDMDVVQNNS